MISEETLTKYKSEINEAWKDLEKGMVGSDVTPAKLKLWLLKQNPVVLVGLWSKQMQKAPTTLIIQDIVDSCFEETDAPF